MNRMNALGPARWVCAVLVIGLIAVGSARGTLILGNDLDPPYQGDGTVFNDGRTLKGVGLQMAAGPSYSLDWFSVVLEHISGTPQVTGYVYANDGSLTPVALLATLTTGTVSGTTQTYDLTPLAPFTLVGGQKYWVMVADGPAPGWYRWDRTDPQGTPTGAPATFMGYTFSHDGGTSWSSSSIYCALEIHGTIPEPVSWMLLVVGAGALLRRKRR